jgi:hypothetical protein
MVHINAHPYDLHSPPACGSYGEGERIISQSVACNILYFEPTKLDPMGPSELCEKCLDEVEFTLWEIWRTKTQEIAELDAYAKKWSEQ